MKLSKSPKVSVMMITYNHEAFIAHAIESVLMQETDFPYELVIGEDCSTDATRAICLEYLERFPDKIRLILPEKNLGVCENGLRTYLACTGEYIAFIEGDDYWTVPYKLQRQVDFLDRNPEFSMCFTRDATLDETGDKQVRPSTRRIKASYGIEDICRSCDIMSATILFRRQPEITAVFRTGLNAFHWVLLVYVAQFGKIGFIDEVMAVYRSHAGGVYSNKRYLDQLIMNVQAAEAWYKLIGDHYDSGYHDTAAWYYLEILREALRDGRDDVAGIYALKLGEILPKSKKSIYRLKYFLVDSQRAEVEKNVVQVFTQRITQSMSKMINILLSSPSRNIRRVLSQLRNYSMELLSRLRVRSGSTQGVFTPRSWEGKPHEKGSFPGMTPPSEGRKNLIILDDVFPQPLSAFRVAEYNYYLDHIEDSVVYSTGYGFRWLRESRSFDEVVAEYESTYQNLTGRVFRFDESKVLNAKLAYFVFLGNAVTFLDVLEKNKVPFVFTLYPGGSFALEQEASDKMLRKVLTSQYFRKVIVTQKVSYEYLISRKFCNPSSIEFFYGGVFPSHGASSNSGNSKLHFALHKVKLDICFVAHKYTERGVDKGYDVFIAVARILCSRADNIAFHVVGPFDERDIEVSDMNNRITFYGSLNSTAFQKFYATKDIILSPNIPFAVTPGTFDGFPTGACIEAGLNGVVPFITDPLNQNIKFKDGEDIVIIPHDAEQIAEIIERYYRDPERLNKMSARTRKVFGEVFSMEAQMKPRVDLLRKYLHLEGNQ